MNEGKKTIQETFSNAGDESVAKTLGFKITPGGRTCIMLQKLGNYDIDPLLLKELSL